MTMLSLTLAQFETLHVSLLEVLHIAQRIVLSTVRLNSIGF